MSLASQVIIDTSNDSACSAPTQYKNYEICLQVLHTCYFQILQSFRIFICVFYLIQDYIY